MDMGAYVRFLLNCCVGGPFQLSINKITNKSKIVLRTFQYLQLYNLFSPSTAVKDEYESSNPEIASPLKLPHYYIILLEKLPELGKSFNLQQAYLLSLTL